MVELLAAFFNIDEDRIILWSDNTMTIDHVDNIEYIVSDTIRNDLMMLLCCYEGYYIYQN